MTKKYTSFPWEKSIGFYIGLILVVVMGFIFYKTTLGHEIKIVGANRTLAKYAGMN
ncbi:MAG: hypothetical protein QM224_01970, partial [Bacillota bacterium]|nr:hypothetical protein [Bacillota bacterium]